MCESGSTYRRGCRCGECRSSEALRKRNQRAGIKASMLVNRPADVSPGEVESAVMTETAPYLEDHDPLAIAAKRLASILDDGQQIASWPKVAAELRATLSRLHNGSNAIRPRKRGRLAAVQQLHAVKR